ncbi:6049_t:CDS:2, partial [Entrophospora sp. SA101]
SLPVPDPYFDFLTHKKYGRVDEVISEELQNSELELALGQDYLRKENQKLKKEIEKKNLELSLGQDYLRKENQELKKKIEKKNLELSLGQVCLRKVNQEPKKEIEKKNLELSLGQDYLRKENQELKKEIEIKDLELSLDQDYLRKENQKLKKEIEKKNLELSLGQDCLRKENQELKKEIEKKNLELSLGQDCLRKKNQELKKEIGEKRLELNKVKEALGQKQSDVDLSVSQQQELVAQKQEIKHYLSLKQTENLKLREKVTELEKKVHSLEKELLERKLIGYKSELNNLLIVIKEKSKMEQKELLDDLLEAQVELIKFNNTFIQKQLEKTKNKLTSSSEISEKEIKAILQKQQEITKLEIQMERFPSSRIKLTSSTTNEDRGSIASVKVAFEDKFTPVTFATSFFHIGIVSSMGF